MDGWVKLHRRFLEWEWYMDIPTKTLFIHLLLRANSKDNYWRGMKISRGQIFTSIKHLSDETGLSIKQARRSVDKLKKTGELGIQVGNNGTMITICNYDIYQGDEEKKGKPNGKEGANEGQTEGQQTRRNKERKEGEEYVPNPRFEKFNTWIQSNCPNVIMMKEQVSAEQFEKMITKYSDKEIVSTLSKMDNWKPLVQKNISVYKTFINWIEKDRQESKVTSPHLAPVPR